MVALRAATFALLAVGAVSDLKRKERPEDPPRREPGNEPGRGAGGDEPRRPGWGRPEEPARPLENGYLTSAGSTRLLEWTPMTRTAHEAMEITFPKQAGWPNACFRESGCAGLREAMQPTRVALWVEDELLRGAEHPFHAFDGKLPVPQPVANDTGDQLDEGDYVVYSRRQVCFIVAKVLLGAGTKGYDNGLSRILNKTVPHCGSPSPSVKRPEGFQPSALSGEFGIALWGLLSACAADPTLRQGAQGPSIVVAKGAARPPVDAVRAAAADASLEGARLSACRYDDGDAGPVDAEGFEQMHPYDCTPPTVGAPGRDFMAGGGTKRLKGQAIQDISAKFLGGYVFGNACGLGGGQDERLMTYFPEVFALTFLLSENEEHPQLREPAWILGARMLAIGLDGTARFDHRLEVDEALPMESDLASVIVGDKVLRVSQSTPFLAFMSENQDFLGESAWWEGKRSLEEMQENMFLARQNRHPLQREVDASVWFSFMYQVRAWYAAVALTSYHMDLHRALRGMVRSLGAGPFLAGLWFGDSQLGFLTMWIAHAIAAKTWGDDALPLQYYIYADFTENPGNQCFVHSGDDCRECLRRCAANPLPPSSFWLPDYAFMGPGANQSCVVDSEQFCGEKGFTDVVAAYAKLTARQLWDDVERVLGEANATEVPREQVFDLLFAATN